MRAENLPWLRVHATLVVVGHPSVIPLRRHETEACTLPGHVTMEGNAMYATASTAPPAAQNHQSGLGEYSALWNWGTYSYLSILPSFSDLMNVESVPSVRPRLTACALVLEAWLSWREMA